MVQEVKISYLLFTNDSWLVKIIPYRRITTPTVAMIASLVSNVDILGLDSPRVSDISIHHLKTKLAKVSCCICNPHSLPSCSSSQQQQQQKQSLAPPPHQAKTDAAAAQTVPAAQGETPMEQEAAPEGGGADSQPSAADSGEAKDAEGTSERSGMPEHPGRDSDSEGSGQEEEEQ